MTSLLPLKLFPALFFAIPILPAFLLHWAATRLEQRNFRDPAGFRARTHRQLSRSGLWLAPLFMLVPLLFVYLAISGLRGIKLSPKLLVLFAAAISLYATLVSARQFAINRDRFQVTTFLSSLIMSVGWLAIGFGWLPMVATSFVIVAYSLISLTALRVRPFRMDYNLFQRAAQNLLGTRPPENYLDETSTPLNRTELFAFARFLGERFLVIDYRWQTSGLVLRAPPIKQSLREGLRFFFPYGKSVSTLSLGRDGTVLAYLGTTDQQALASLNSHALVNSNELEKDVIGSVALALRNFRRGDLTSAERALGQVPDSAIFLSPPSRSRAIRWRRNVTLGLVIPCLVLYAVMFFAGAWMSGLKPVNVTEAQVRSFLNNLKTSPMPKHSSQRVVGLELGLDLCLVLPPTNLLSPDTLRAVHDMVFLSTGFPTQGDDSSKLSAFRGSWLLHKAMTRGWVDWPATGLKPQDATLYFHQLKTNEWQFTLSRESSWSWVKEERNTLIRINDLTLSQLRWLRDVDCLDLVNRGEIIRQIADAQVLSATPSPGQPSIHDWRDVRGLFFAPGWPALHDTYFSLAALEILGALDRIDREACIRGILRRHHGKGFFDSPSSGGLNEYDIKGDAQDTFSAFESLRILGALDRVKDLEKWKFRSHRFSGTRADGEINWFEVEAWICQRRLEQHLREHRENPQAQIRSLLDQ